jgi:H+/gluconate symporter-like permease
MGGLAWLQYRVRSLKEGYAGASTAAPFTPDKELRERSAGEGFDLMEVPVEEPPRDLPAPAVAVLPLVLVIALNLLFTFVIIPAMDTGYLALPLYGETSIDQVRGIWAVIAALVLSTLVLIALNWSRLSSLKTSIDSGANASLLPIFNTASLVGFGAVIASLPAFAIIRDGVIGLGAANPLISLAIAVNLLAGITGSASGGMSIALGTLGDTYVTMAEQAGIPLELMHRVTTVATGGLDSLPHNGAVVTLLAICGLTHREAYRDIFVVAVLIPMLSLVLLITLGTLFGGF